MQPGPAIFALWSTCLRHSLFRRRREAAVFAARGEVCRVCAAPPTDPALLRASTRKQENSRGTLVRQTLGSSSIGPWVKRSSKVGRCAGQIRCERVELGRRANHQRTAIRKLCRRNAHVGGTTCVSASLRYQSGRREVPGSETAHQAACRKRLAAIRHPDQKWGKGSLP